MKMKTQLNYSSKWGLTQISHFKIQSITRNAKRRTAAVALRPEETGVFTCWATRNAVHDKMLPLLGLGEQLFQRYEQFVNEADSPGRQLPSSFFAGKMECCQFKTQRPFQKTLPMNGFNATRPLRRRFQKEPNRNRLNLLINANHLSYHYGQLILLKI
jgi:hypothetical protein